MHTELEVLKIVSERLQAAHIPYMLTGSFAMAYYGQPRMTRDIDLVVSLEVDNIPSIVSVLSPDFYIDADDARSAVESQRRDVEVLLDDSIDRKYLDHWAARLGVADMLKEIIA